MLKINVNGSADVRTLSPFAYKDMIKSLEKSNEARVVFNGVPVFRSAVTSGRDVKANSGMKYHLYFYPTEAACKAGPAGGLREWMPLTAEEFRAYKNDPGYRVVIDAVKETSIADDLRAILAEPTDAPVVVAPKGKKAQRATAKA